MAGLAAAALLAVVFVVLSLVERGFLARVGWSSIRRTSVEWPSLLERGPHGWVLQVAFVIGGMFGLVFSAALWSRATSRKERVGPLGLGVLSAAVSCMAFPPNLPASPVRWTNVVHNTVYPIIPVAALVAAFALVSDRRAGRGRQRVSSALFLALSFVALGLTFVSAIAQVARSAFFAALLLWIAYLAWVELRDYLGAKQRGFSMQYQLIPEQRSRQP